MVRPVLPVSGVELAFAAGMDDAETIVSIGPDRVVGRDVEDLEILDAIQAVAPVLSVDGGGDRKTDLRRIGAAVGRTERAEELIADHEARLAEVRGRHGEQIERARVGVLQYGADESQPSWSAPKGFYHQSQALSELGGTFPDLLAAAFSSNYGSYDAARDALGLVDATYATVADE